MQPLKRLSGFMLNKSEMPVSHIQKQFWLLDQQGQNSAYHVVSAFSSKNMDSERLISSVRKVVAKYSVLNSSFKIQDGQLVQATNPSESCELIIKSVADENEAQEHIYNQSYKKFDLEQGPLIRLIISEINDTGTHFFALVFHHIIIDLHSKELIANEISAVYSDLASEILADNNTSDYPTWHQQWLSSPASEKARGYWLETIENLTPTVTMPEKGDSGQFFEIPFELKKRHVDLLSEYCKRERSDIFLVLFTAYHHLLSCYSGLHDFAVAVPLTNRKQDQFKNSMGCFVNTLPIRINGEGVRRFGELRQQARKAFLGAHRYQELPLTEIIKLNGEVKGQRNLYNVGFTFEQPMHLELAGVETRSVVLPMNGAQLDCFLRLWFDEGTIKGRLETHGGMWTEALATRFSESLQCFILSLVKSSTDQLSELSYLPKQDRSILARFNSTRMDEISGLKWQDLTLVSLFENQVNKSPDKTALVMGEEHLTYRELDRLAGSFAHLLTDQGVRSGDVVAIYSERSIEMVIAIYATLKTGAAYLPLDISLPAARISKMLKQAEVDVCVLGPQQQIPDSIDTRTVCCDRNKLDLNLIAETCNPKPGDAAYVIFTSGSTGDPKGVINSHGGIVNRLLWMQDYFDLQPEENILQKTPYSFDVSVWELFWPLQVGATMAIAEHDSHKDPYRIIEQISKQKINVIHFVPSMLSAFVDALSDEALPTKLDLRAVICSGEELTVALQNKFKMLFPSVGLYNLYGPTEAAVDVTYWRCDDNYRKQVPIGAPVYNTQLHVVDTEGRLVPIGVKGELWIAGSQVAEGYIHNESLTQDRFIQNPFDSGTIYRTGDVVRWTDEGYLEYFGRNDFQVKINGIRIELGEIENAIVLEDGVSLCTVMVHNVGQTQRLIAYFSAEPSVTLSETTLRANLANRLPSYMIPAQFIQLDIFPLNANGKVKRSALPPPELYTNLNAVDSLTLPESKTEQVLFQLWSRMLQRSQFGIDDTFFSLGGDSMLLMALYQELKKMFKTDIKSVEMFRYTTIKSLAERIDVGVKAPAPAMRGERATRIQQALSSGPRGPRKRMR